MVNVQSGFGSVWNLCIIDISRLISENTNERDFAQLNQAPASAHPGSRTVDGEGNGEAAARVGIEWGRGVGPSPLC